MHHQRSTELDWIDQAQQALFCFISTRSQIVARAAICMKFLHHPAVSLDDVFPAGAGLQPKDVQSFALSQRVAGIATGDATKTGMGFYPVTADTSKKRHTVPKECSCPNAGNSVQNSNVKPSR